MNEDRFVMIPVSDFEEMIITRTHFDMLVDTLFENARLNYKGDDVYIENEEVRTVLKLICPYRLNAKLKELKENENEQSD